MAILNVPRRFRAASSGTHAEQSIDPSQESPMLEAIVKITAVVTLIALAAVILFPG